MLQMILENLCLTIAIKHSLSYIYQGFVKKNAKEEMLVYTNSFLILLSTNFIMLKLMFKQLHVVHVGNKNVDI